MVLEVLAIPEGGFERQLLNETIVTHVLETYLPRKLSNYLGVKCLHEEDKVVVPRDYGPQEGKIKGL